MKWAVALLALGLAGCAGSPVREAMTTPQQKATEDTAYCRGIGAQEGTNAFVSCRLAREQWRQQSVQNGLAMAATGAQIYAASTPPPRQTVNCTSSQGIGGTVNTTCH